MFVRDLRYSLESYKRDIPLKISNKEKVLLAVAAACANSLLATIYFHVQSNMLINGLGITGVVAMLVALCLQAKRHRASHS